MRRRQLLASALLASPALAGCSSLDPRRAGYPDPPDDAVALSYEVHRRIDGERILAGDEYEGLALITDADGRDALAEGWMTDADRAFVDGTDFSTQFLLAISVVTSGDSTGIEVLDVVRTGDGVVRSYSHVADPSMQDDAYPRGFLVRVEQDGSGPPSRARHTHRGGNSDLDVTATPSS